MYLLRKSKFLLIFVITAYLGICFFMWAAQRKLLYFSDHEIKAPSTYGFTSFTDEVLKTTDRLNLHIWQHEAKTGFPTILFFHGNSGNMAYRGEYFQALADAGFGLIGVDYRGFGASEGSPTEAGIYIDARTVVDYALHSKHIAAENIIFYGESLGTGVAVQMATEYASGAVILQSPYSSIEARASDRYYWLPVHYLLVDHFDSISKIAKMHQPLLIIHGELDTIVPVQDARNLFAQANEPKEAVYFPKEGHGFTIPEMMGALVPFLNKHKLIKQ